MVMPAMLTPCTAQSCCDRDREFTSNLWTPALRQVQRPTEMVLYVGSEDVGYSRWADGDRNPFLCSKL